MCTVWSAAVTSNFLLVYSKIRLFRINFLQSLSSLSDVKAELEKCMREHSDKEEMLNCELEDLEVYFPLTFAFFMFS